MHRAMEPQDSVRMAAATVATALAMVVTAVRTVDTAVMALMVDTEATVVMAATTDLGPCTRHHTIAWACTAMDPTT